MSSKSREQSRQPTIIEIKGSSFTLPVLKLLGNDVDLVIKQLQTKISQAPDFFHNAPIVIDLTKLSETGQKIDFTQLGKGLKKNGLIPVGVRGGNEKLNEAAQTSNFSVLADGKAEPKTTPTAEQIAPEIEPPVPTPPPEPPTTEQIPVIGSRLVTRPVRSGQKIYAAGTDLIILAPVSYGAEIMADGNIHIYGTLRGRALAGVLGDLEARIFCIDLRAELISIAGHYRISENLDETLAGKPVQIRLDGSSLIIDEL